MELTKEDYNVLIESVDCWVDKDFGESLIGGLMTSIMTKDAPPEAIQKMKEKEEADRVERKNKKQLRKEQAIMLKAKLLKLRDKAEATAFCENS